MIKRFLIAAVIVGLFLGGLLRILSVEDILLRQLRFVLRLLQITISCAGLELAALD